jgi:hypothetical protein
VALVIQKWPIATTLTFTNPTHHTTTTTVVVIKGAASLGGHCEEQGHAGVC